MLNIYLDTALLSVPSYATDAASAQELVDRVTHFSLVVSSSLPLMLIVGDDAEVALGAGYPTLQSIQDYLQMMDLEYEYSANDLLRQYLTILTRASRPEALEVVEVRSISSFSVDPPIPPGLSPGDLEDETRRIFATVGLNIREQPAWRLGSSIQGITEQNYSIAATITSLTASPEISAPTLPYTFSAQVKTTANLGSALVCENASDLWVAASTAQERHLAILAGALHLRRQRDSSATIGDLRSFSLGSSFEDSLKEHDCSGLGRYSLTTFELCCQIVADLCNREIKIMGRPNQEVRTEDNATAWRVHVTKAGLALRLMIWQNAGAWEFANVGVKHALRIEAGKLSERSELASKDTRLLSEILAP